VLGLDRSGPSHVLVPLGNVDQLDKDPDRRFPAMADVRKALQHLTGGRADATASIAVLPFANLSADPEQECFSDGLADEIISALAKICVGFELAGLTPIS